jgi:hypothetical protein
VSADEVVAVVEVVEDGGHERLEHLRLGEAVEEEQRDAADVLVGVLQVVVEVLAGVGRVSPLRRSMTARFMASTLAATSLPSRSALISLAMAAEPLSKWTSSVHGLSMAPCRTCTRAGGR